MLLALCVAGCGVHPARGPAPASPAGGHAVEGRLYRIDPAASELRILVYRAGPLAALGHNHVIANHALSGVAHVTPGLSGSTFQLVVPVAAFEVDPPALRREEGEDFSADIGADARNGTLHNLLGPGLLDADHYPQITLEGVRVEAGARGLTARLRTRVAGHESIIEAAFTTAAVEGGMAASGTLTLRQSALGLTPFSIMLGALQVRDEMTVRFHLVARPATGP